MTGCKRRLIEGVVGSRSSRGLPLHELNIVAKRAEEDWRPGKVSRSIDQLQSKVSQGFTIRVSVRTHTDDG